jgi:hypothetical protein
MYLVLAQSVALSTGHQRRSFVSTRRAPALRVSVNSLRKLGDGAGRR